LPESVCVFVIRPFFCKTGIRQGLVVVDLARGARKTAGQEMLFRFASSGPENPTLSAGLPLHHRKSCEPLQVPACCAWWCCKNKLLARGQLALATVGAVVWHCTGQLRHRADGKAVPTPMWNMARVCGRFR
jgi:hypothetical protein